MMDQLSLQQIDYTRILARLADYAVTKRAQQDLRTTQPLTNRKQLEQMLLEVSEGKKIMQVSSSIPLYPLDQLDAYLEHAKKGFFLQPEQLQRVLSFLEHCRKLKNFMKDKEVVAPQVANYVYSIGDLSKLEDEISRSLRHGQIDDQATVELANIRRHLRLKQSEVKQKAEAMSRSKRLSPFLQEQIVVEKNGRHTIPVKKEFRYKVPGSVVDISSSGATVFMEPKEVAAIYEELEYFLRREELEIEKILYTLTGMILEQEQDLQIAIETMHHYDIIFAKVKYGLSIDGVIPELNESYHIILKEARHPLLGEKAVPLSLHLGREEHALVITGPNTGGKTVTLKTVGLLTMMAQTGLMLPVAEGTSLHVFEKLFVDIGDGQSIDQNLSTFSSRLTNIIKILEQTDDRTLVLLDELGSGTDPHEGMALAQVILEQLYTKGATILATTHYGELKKLAETHQGFLNGSMEFDLASLQPTYRLLLGETGHSQAFQITLKLGLHPELVQRAHQLAGQKQAVELTYPEDKKRSYQLQMAVKKKLRQLPKEVGDSTLKKASVTLFEQGDNVKVLPEESMAIVYNGPDHRGDYVVYSNGEMKRVNYKRLRLYIAGSQLYPPDYDFDIIFKSKEYRKKKHLMDRKHVQDMIIEEE